MLYILKKILKLIFKLVLVLIVIVALLFVLFNWPVKSKNENMEWGISFSTEGARGIGLDWKETYLAILDDLKPERVRIASYWTQVEKEPGVYDFSDVDFQLVEAEKRGLDVVLAIGMKVPRWPECFIPEIYGGNKEVIGEENALDPPLKKGEIKERREAALLAYEKAFFERYKGNKTVKIWQVENEPFLPFGDCPKGAITEELVDKEVNQAREILGKEAKIMVTDSGELSLWIESAKRSDVFGTTLYRTIYNHRLGYVTYPISPMFFRIKGMLVNIFTDAEDIIISELQAEPWGPKWIIEMDKEEQYKSMSPEKLRGIAEYAQKTKFSQAYLWGAEWWYWLKVNRGEDEMWETGREIINSSNPN